jgi:hypothetical protein
MRIEISVDATEPPQGTVVIEEAEPIPFAGWLDLLRVLSDLLEEQP